MEYFPVDRLDDDNRSEEIRYLVDFLRGRLQGAEAVLCFLCGEPRRSLVVVVDDNKEFRGYACVPCAAALDIAEHRQADGCYQIGD